MSRTDINIVKMRAMVLENRHSTIDELEIITGISWSSVKRILTEDLTIARVAEKFMLRIRIIVSLLSKTV